MKFVVRRAVARRRSTTPNPHAARLALLERRPFRLTSDAWEVEPGFGFDALADAIARVIVDTTPQLTLGLYGPWGSGKTTLLHAIDERIRSDACAVAWFDMWEHKNQEDVVPFLLDAIAFSLPQGSRLAERMHDFARVALASATVSAGRVSFSEADFLKQLDELRKRPKLARETLDAAVGEWREQQDGSAGGGGQRRIVVIVDNIDRCLPAQAVHLLEQTSSLFDFEGIVFLLAAEKDRLAAAVEQTYALPPKEGDVYLEKIVQVEFRVPGLDRGRVIHWVKSLCDDEFTLDDDDAELLAEAADWNPRRIKRLLDNVRILLCTTRPEFADAKGLALASTLLLYRDRTTWARLTSSGDERAQEMRMLTQDGGSEVHE